jgi:hypothetical protein
LIVTYLRKVFLARAISLLDTFPCWVLTFFTMFKAIFFWTLPNPSFLIFYPNTKWPNLQKQNEQNG